MSVAIEHLHKRAPFAHVHRVVPGMTRAKLYQQWAQMGFTKGAEIGVADGRNALTLCQAIPNLDLLCVDPWMTYRGNRRGGPQEQHDGNYLKAQERLKPYRVTFTRAMSAEVAKDTLRESLDFVYIDGNHAESFVFADLALWSQRVRAGGVVAGHDFYEFAHAGVVDAVVRYTTLYGITDWHVCDEREPSFWWVKS